MIVEVHTAASPDPARLGARVSGRIGVIDQLEVRLWSPQLVFADDVVSVGGLGVGVKYAAPIGDSAAVSVVPEFFFGEGWFTRVGLNLSGRIDKVTLRGHLSPALSAGEEVSVLVGGRLAYAAGSLTPYLHGGAGHNVGAFVGGGTALSLGPAAQLDAGVDIPLVSPVVPTLLFGASFGF